MLGELRARVGDEMIMEIVGQCGAAGRNGSGERLLAICAEGGEVVVGNSLVMKKYVLHMGRNGGRKGDGHGADNEMLLLSKQML